MKQYHTQIDIDAPIAKVWEYLTDFKAYPAWNPLVGMLEGKMESGQKINTFIVPLGRTFEPVLLTYVPEKEFSWKGVQGVSFLLAGEHYYKLEAITSQKTRLLHGEYFTGLLSIFLSPRLLCKMENTFELHNQRLKERIEREA